MTAKQFKTSPASYRWDINIYRAMAVLAVLLFHLRIPGFGSGFLGVDLFFLISGYVITQSLERKRGESFSAGEFFLGRAYRIFPMVGFTVLLTLILGVIFLAPTDLVKAAQSSLATLFSVANIYFWATIDYFDPASAAKPLLHMWSLGVEEQFYLVFPLIFIAFATLARRRMAIGVVFALTTLLSLGVAITGSVSDSSLFYLLPFRMNQFLAGSLAFYVVNAAVGNARLRKGLWIAVSLILLALSAWLDLPAEYRLSALVTFAVMPVFVLNWSSIASSAVFTPLHRLADWSYSIYVLHWPIIAFWVVAWGDLDTLGIVLCGSLTIVSAWLTYRFVEKPYQSRRRTKGSWRDALKTVIAPMLLIAALALALIFSKGLAFRAGGDVAQMLEKFDEDRQNMNFATRQKNTIQPSEFSADKTSVVVIGDSFAGGLYIILKDIPGIEAHFGMATSAFCRALTIPKKPKHAERCSQNMTLLDGDYSKTDIIFIVESSASHGVYDASDEAAYEATFNRLRAKGFKGRIVLAGPRPIYKKAPYQTAYALNTLKGLRESVAGDLILDANEMNVLGTRMADWAKSKDVTLFSLFPILCNMESCAVTNADNELIYLDRVHISEAAAPLLENALSDVLIKNKTPVMTIPSIGPNRDAGSFTDPEIAALTDKYGAVKLSLLRSDTAAATRVTEAYLDELERNGEDVGAKIRELWNQSSDISNRRAALMLAEHQLSRKNNVSARYLAGLSYFQGVSVAADTAKVISLWDHPSMKRIGSVQYRLSEIYNNPDSEFYDPKKAAQKLVLSQELGYKPQ